MLGARTTGHEQLHPRCLERQVQIGGPPVRGQRLLATPLELENMTKLQVNFGVVRSACHGRPIGGSASASRLESLSMLPCWMRISVRNGDSFSASP